MKLIYQLVCKLLSLTNNSIFNNENLHKLYFFPKHQPSVQLHNMIKWFGLEIISSKQFHQHVFIGKLFFCSNDSEFSCSKRVSETGQNKERVREREMGVGEGVRRRVEFTRL